MSTYKNLEIYNLAFNLAMKVYKLNMVISDNLLIKFGNKLRRTSFLIKDLIADGYMGPDEENKRIRVLTFAETQTEETLTLLKKMKAEMSNSKQTEDLIQSYKSLKKQITKHIEKIQEESNAFLIPFPEKENYELV